MAMGSVVRNSFTAALVIVLSTCATAVHLQAAVEPPVPMIVQAAALDTPAATVRAVGGVVTHELGIIRAVGASLTPSQIDRLRTVDGIRLHEDRPVRRTGSAPRHPSGGGR